MTVAFQQNLLTSISRMLARFRSVESSKNGSPLTAHPYIAILGVLVGALTSVLCGRLLSVGLADVQGAIGADSDAMSWLSTAFNAANMFIGPLTVFLGGLYGPRKVLLWAGFIFLLSEFLAPLAASNFALLLILQIIAGLSSGTFYPLTMTVLMRNLPIHFIQFGVAVYSLDILASTHIATLLEAWYIHYFSWRWVFWNALLVTPLLMLCIAMAVPAQPAPAAGPKTNLTGFLYASVALTFVYVGIDQGDRLDWFNSAIVTACLAASLLMSVVAVARHSSRPHPLINLKFLYSRNLLLLGLVLVLFRFAILAPTLLVPKFLGALHGYRPDETGAVLAWTAALVVVAAPLAGFLLYRVDSRLMCAFGFLLAGFTSLACAQISPDWIGQNFVVTQILDAVALTFALTGLLGTILRHGMLLGALSNPVNILTLSCWFQVCRLLGGEIGKSVLTRFLVVRSEFHYNVLAQNIDGGTASTEILKSLAAVFQEQGDAPANAVAAALSTLATVLRQQITILAIADAFVLLSCGALLALIAITLISYAPPLPKGSRNK